LSQPIEPTDPTPSSGTPNRTPWIVAGIVAIVVALLVAFLALRDDDDSSAGGSSVPTTATTDGSNGGDQTDTSAPAGATPEEITAGQGALTAVGCYTGPIDGLYGPATDQAIRDFQEAAGLEVDGIFGPATLGALETAVAAGETVCTGDEVRTARLTTSDGLDQTLDLVTCEFVGESEFELTARTETSDLSVSVNGEDSLVLFQSADGNREGTVDTVTDEEAVVTVTGSLSKTDDSADPATFELVAGCG
jgi:hypothetical protein